MRCLRDPLGLVPRRTGVSIGNGPHHHQHQQGSAALRRGPLHHFLRHRAREPARAQLSGRRRYRRRSGKGRAGVRLQPDQERLQALCDGLDERTLLPGRSPHLAIAEEQGYTVAHFNGERIPFLPRDALTLPVANITVEALADWLGGELLRDPGVAALHMHRLTVRVSSGAGQWAQSSFAPGESDTGRQTAGADQDSTTADDPATGAAG